MKKIKNTRGDLLKCLAELQKIRLFKGSPPEFWALFLDFLILLGGAEGGAIAARRKEGNQSLALIAARACGSILSADKKNLSPQVSDQIHTSLLDENNWFEHEGLTLFCYRIDTGSAAEYCVVCLRYTQNPAGKTGDIPELIGFAADIPLYFQLRRMAGGSKVRVEQLSNVLDLMVVLNDKKRFLASAMVLCNELATRLSCERVSIGWFEKGYIRLQAISHVDRFDKKAGSVRKLEQAQEEALDQDEEVLYPATVSGGTINRTHREYAKENDVEYICSLPLRGDGEAIAVCTCERNSTPFSEDEVRLLRLACDQASRRLQDLKRLDRWFGARFAAYLREKLGKIIGYRHTWAKVVGLLIVIGLGILIFGKMDYRISAPVILRTESITYLTAPFDGHIEEVMVRTGDTVAEGDILLSLDQSDLHLQETGLIAEKNRYMRETEKARATSSLADMRIAQSLLEGSNARLQLIRHQLNQAVLKAPYDGVVVEGDQMERIGSPTQQGEVLFKLARIDRLYAELEVPERDVHELFSQQTGEMILASRPRDVFPITVYRIEPVAVPEEDGNIFIVRGNFATEIADWWRPGMTGIAKLDTGRRNILWVITHRTLDFLRLRLWF